MDTTKTTADTSNKGMAVRLIGLILEIPPAAYVALTGHVPLWARIWLSVWLSLWLLTVVVQAIWAQTSRGER